MYHPDKRYENPPQGVRCKKDGHILMIPLISLRLTYLIFYQRYASPSHCVQCKRDGHILTIPLTSLHLKSYNLHLTSQILHKIYANPSHCVQCKRDGHILTKRLPQIISCCPPSQTLSVPLFANNTQNMEITPKIWKQHPKL